MRLILLLLAVVAIISCTSTVNKSQVEVSKQFTTADPEYGYDEAKPVQLGGFLMGRQSEGAHFQYFENLRGPAGQLVEVQRLGSCCAFEDPTLPFGGGLLDRYLLTYEGQDKPAIIYINLYKFEKPMAPVGFTLL